MGHTERSLWQRTLGEIQRVVGAVRAGADLTPKQWPDGAPAAVALTFDVDGETLAICDGTQSPSAFSRGEFGTRVGVPRILRLLSEFGINATFFVPAMTSILHSELAPAILDAGAHEIGLHGWIYESVVDIDPEQERDLTEQAFRYWTDMTGTAPQGIRTPSWDFSAVTLDIIRDLGFRYDSSLMADDRPYEIESQAAGTGIIELPVDWKLDDYMYFHIDYKKGYHPYIKPDDVYAIWRSEFDVACQEGTAFVLTMHPQIIGHPSRVAMLRKLIGYMHEKGAWITSLNDIAKYVQPD